MNGETVQKTTETANSLIAAIPPFNRHLILYLLDLICVFSSHSARNRMTWKRIIAAFQPSLLSGPPGTMNMEDYKVAAEIVIVFAILLENDLLVYA